MQKAFGPGSPCSVLDKSSVDIRRLIENVEYVVSTVARRSTATDCRKAFRPRCSLRRWDSGPADGSRLPPRCARKRQLMTTLFLKRSGALGENVTKLPLARQPERHLVKPQRSIRLSDFPLRKIQGTWPCSVFSTANIRWRVPIIIAGWCRQRRWRFTWPSGRSTPSAFSSCR